MIAYVKGILTEKEPTRVVIEVAGIGYELVIPLSTYERLPREGEQVKLLTHHSVREDDETLFGFWCNGERDLFLKLVSVSGVGPKIAIAILSGSSMGELTMAIATGDAKRIASIKGVGKKTAEKICVELRDKVNALEALGMGGANAMSTPQYLRDAALALGALGFAPDTASKMVAKVAENNPEAKDVEAVIKAALSSKER